MAIKELNWSGKGAVPAVGAIVEVKVNGIGFGRVVGYFEEDGWLGCRVSLATPPDWYLKNNGGKNEPCYAFGAEIKIVEA